LCTTTVKERGGSSSAAPMHSFDLEMAGKGFCTKPRLPSYQENAGEHNFSVVWGRYAKFQWYLFTS
jgi:hypothetical protein